MILVVRWKEHRGSVRKRMLKPEFFTHKFHARLTEAVADTSEG